MRKTLWIFLAGGAILVLSGSFFGCGQTAWPDHDASILEDPSVDDVKFWPPTNGYLHQGDSARVLLTGLQRVYTCTRLLQLQAEFQSIVSDRETLRIRTTLELPATASCAQDRDGLDTTLRVDISQAEGTQIFLQNGMSVSTEADTVVAGISTLDSLDFLTDSTRTARSGKFLFLDSSSTRSKRLLVADSMVKCETFEGAVYERLGASYRVHFRILALDSLLHPSYPPCVGIHADTLEVVQDKYGYSFRP